MIKLDKLTFLYNGEIHVHLSKTLKLYIIFTLLNFKTHKFIHLIVFSVLLRKKIACNKNVNFLIDRFSRQMGHFSTAYVPKCHIVCDKSKEMAHLPSEIDQFDQ